MKKGSKHSLASILKMKGIFLGNKNPMFGKVGARKGKKNTEIQNIKIGNSHRGKILSEETKQKIKANHWTKKGYKPSMLGKHHSKETIQKIKEKLKGHKVTKEQILKHKISMDKLHKRTGKTINCLCCNKEFYILPCFIGVKKFCSKECYYVYTKDRNGSSERICFNCNKKVKVFNSRKNKKFFCSKKCHYEYIQVPENCSNYIKDRTKVKSGDRSFRFSKRMSMWKKVIYKRDNYTCQLCGVRSSKGKAVVLNCHHIKRFVDKPEIRFDTSNGITLCEQCHKKTYKKEKSFEKQFIEIINAKHNV